MHREHNPVAASIIILGMKKFMLSLLALLFLVPMIPMAEAQVVVKIGHPHHRHCWWSHHHRHCRYR
jgi:hypothetical protein